MLILIANMAKTSNWCVIKNLKVPSCYIIYRLKHNLKFTVATFKNVNCASFIQCHKIVMYQVFNGFVNIHSTYFLKKNFIRFLSKFKTLNPLNLYSKSLMFLKFCVNYIETPVWSEMQEKSLKQFYSWLLQ